MKGEREAASTGLIQLVWTVVMEETKCEKREIIRCFGNSVPPSELKVISPCSLNLIGFNQPRGEKNVP